MPIDFYLSQVSWHTHFAELMAVREQVFITEQHVDPAFEWDTIDATAIHLLAYHNNKPIGCTRIIAHQKIGRMAVLRPWRGFGVGSALLLKAVAICEAYGSQVVNLTAQTHAISFYQQAGFIAVSDIYQDANIPHVDMQLILPKIKKV